MGKSSSGKDTIYKRLMKDGSLGLREIIPCTTRPIREGETDGVEYYFYTEQQLADLEQEGKIIELRAYDTIYGIWKYFTTNEGIDLAKYDYITISTVESYESMQTHFGADALVPIYIQVEDGLRLQRALDREHMQEEPGYAEVCRRFLADEADFSDEKLRQAGIRKRFLNQRLPRTVEEIKTYIEQYLYIERTKQWV